MQKEKNQALALEGIQDWMRTDDVVSALDSKAKEREKKREEKKKKREGKYAWAQMKKIDPFHIQAHGQYTPVHCH